VKTILNLDIVAWWRVNNRKNVTPTETGCEPTAHEDIFRLAK
jgi:hypothetical protein